MIGLSLDGARLLVTGGSQGVGLAVAEAAVEAGAAVLVLCGRDADKGARAVETLAGRGTEVHFEPMDLAGADAPERLFDAALGRVGELDALVNAAGITTRASFVDARLADWDALFAVNARAPFFLMQRLIRHLVTRDAPGSIVNVSSMNAYCGIPELAVYSATKAALSGMTKNAAHAHLADRIRVNAIAMGWAPTPAEREMQGVTLGRGEDWLGDVVRAMPLGRLLEAREVAHLTVYLLSDLSGLQTGTVVDLEQKVVGAI